MKHRTHLILLIALSMILTGCDRAEPEIGLTFRNVGSLGLSDVTADLDGETFTIERLGAGQSAGTDLLLANDERIEVLAFSYVVEAQGEPVEHSGSFRGMDIPDDKKAIWIEVNYGGEPSIKYGWE